jgi:hypothetical protein
MTHNEREELMKRISEAWRQGYKQGIEDTVEEAEKAGCHEHVSVQRAVWNKLRHPFNGGEHAD